jgi:hypothetical protein
MTGRRNTQDKNYSQHHILPDMPFIPALSATGPYQGCPFSVWAGRDPTGFRLCRDKTPPCHHEYTTRPTQ